MSEALPAAGSSKNIQVTVKVRPLIKREKADKLPKLWRVKENTIQLIDPPLASNEGYTFDQIFDEETSTAQMFHKIAKPIVDAALNGINGTIFAYGQTSSGKTYTMLGDDESPGIMILAVRQIFKDIQSFRDRQFLLRVGYIEIYNEKLLDLLDVSNTDVKIMEKTRGEVTVTSKEFVVNGEELVMDLLQQGSKERKTGGTKMNERSSRSHTIFRIIIESSLSAEQENEEDRVVNTSYLNLVDLAGTERAVHTGATGSRLIEAGNINKSLLSLSRVISQLADQTETDTFVNYRDSKLTRILAASLGGNAMTAIICNVTPAALDETASTLNFAMSAKKVQNKPHVNEVCSDSVFMKRLIREIKRLNEELANTRSSESQRVRDALMERQAQILGPKPEQNTLRRRTWAPSVSGTGTAGGVSADGPSRESRIVAPGYRTNALAATPSLSSPDEFADAREFTSIFDEAGHPQLPNTPPNDIRRGLLGRKVNSARGCGFLPPPKIRVSSHTLKSSALPAVPVTPPAVATPAPHALELPNGTALIRTPSEFNNRRFAVRNSASPLLTPGHRIEKLESDLSDLRTFTRLESEDSETDVSALQQLRDRVATLEAELVERRAEHEELIRYRTGLLPNSDASSAMDEEAAATTAELTEKLSAAQADVDRLHDELTAARANHEIAVTELDVYKLEIDKLKQAHEQAVQEARAEVTAAHRDRNSQLSAEAAEARKTAALAESLRTSIEYEYEHFQANAKRREQELVSRLNDQSDRSTDDLLATIARLKEELNAAETVVRTHEEHINTMTAATAAQTSSITELQSQLIAAQRETAKTKDELSGRLAELQAQIDGTEKSRADEARTFAGQLERMQQEHRDAELVWENERTVLQQEHDKLVTSLENDGQEKSEMQAATAEAQRRCEELSEQLAGLKTEMEQLQQAHRDAVLVWENERTVLQQEHDKLVTSLKNDGQEKSEMQAATAESERRREELSEQLAGLKTEMQQLQQAHRDAELVWQNERDDWQREHGTLVTSLENADRQKSEMQAANAQSERHREELSEQLAGLKTEMEQLRQAYREAELVWQNERDAWQQERKLATSIENVDQWKSEMQAANAESERRREELSEQLAGLKTQMQQMQKQCSQTSTEYEELSQQMMDAVQDADGAQKKIDELTTELSAMQAKLSETQAQYEIRAETIQQKNTQLDNCKAHLTANNRAACALAVLLGHQSSQINALHARLTARSAEAMQHVLNSSLILDPDALASLAKHCLQSTTAKIDELTAGELHDAVIAEFHGLQQQLADQTQQFEHVEMQYEEKVFGLRQLLNETDSQLSNISDMYERLQEKHRSLPSPISKANNANELHTLRERCELLEQQQRDAETQATRAEHQYHELLSERDENQRAFEATIAAKLDLEEQIERQKEECMQMHALNAAQRDRLGDLDAAERLLIAATETNAASAERLSHLQKAHDSLVLEQQSQRDRVAELLAELADSRNEAQRVGEELIESTTLLRKCEQNCANLDTQLKTATERCAELQPQLETLVAEKTNLVAVIKQTELECTSLRETILDMTTIERTHVESAKLADDMRRTEKEVADRDEQITVLRQQIADMEATRRTIDAETERRIAELQNERDAIRVELSDALKKLELAAKVDSDLTELRAVHAELRADFEQSRSRSETAEKHAEQLQQHVDQLTLSQTEIVGNLTAECDRVRLEKTDLEAAHRKLTVDMEALGKHFDTRTHECQILREHVTKLSDSNKASNSNVLEERDQLRSAQLALTKQMGKMTEEREQQRLEQLATIEESKKLAEERDQLRLEQLGSAEKSKKLIDQLDQLHREQLATGKQLVEIRETHSNLLTQHQALVQACAQQQQLNADLRASNDAIGNKLKVAAAQHERLQIEHGATIKQLQDQHHRDMVRLTEALRATSTELQELRVRCRSEQSFHEKEQKIAELETHIRDLRSADTESRQRNDALQRRNENLAHEVNELRSRQQLDRKTRRRSAHDDSRVAFAGLSTADDAIDDLLKPSRSAPPMQTVHTQTGDATAPCGCMEKDGRIQALERKLGLKECMITKLNMEKDSEHEELKKLITKLEKENDRTKAQMKALQHTTNLSKQQQHQASASGVCNTCNNTATKRTPPPLCHDRQQQTDSLSTFNGSALIAQQQHDQLQQEHAQLASKYNTVKYLCQKRHKTIEQLEQQLQKLLQSQTEAAAQQNGVGQTNHGEKENTPVNCNRCGGSNGGGDSKSLALDVKRLESEISLLRSENTKLQTTQDPKAAHNVAIMAENNRLKTIIDEVEDEQRTIRLKYEGLKRVLIARNRAIQFLEAKCGENKKLGERTPDSPDQI